MLIADLEALALEVGPDVFEEYGTEFVQIIRPTTVPNDYGGEDTSGEVASIEYPCVLEMPATAGQRDARWIAGEEFLKARIQMPAMYLGDPVEVRMTDKVKILEREGNNPERIYQVKDVQNIFGVYLDIGVITE